MMTTPWQLGNIPGPKRAAELSAETAVELIKNAKNPLIVAGPQAFDAKVGSEVLADVLAKLREGAPVVATAHAAKMFLDRGFNEVTPMGIIDLTNKLLDPAWSMNGNGCHDLVIFSGIQYALLSQMLSTLKHFSTNVKTISLDRFFQPHADWSFPNFAEKKWEGEIIKAITELKK